MEPQFFEMIGLRAQGLAFEIVLWTLVTCVGLVVLVREIFARRGFGDAWFGWGVGVVLSGFGGVFLYLALAHHHLYFGAEGLKLSNYGLAIAVGFVVGIYLAGREARRSPAPPDAGQMYDLAFWLLVAAMVGSRLLFVVVEWRRYTDLCFDPAQVPGAGGQADCLAAFKFWEGGLVFFGGFIFAIAAGAIYCWRNRVGFLRAADVVIPSVAIGHFFGRLGCLSAGCCFGRVCELPWAVRMPLGSAAYEAQRGLIHTDPELASRLVGLQHSLPIHPTQLYEASAELLFFGLLIWLRGRKRFHGQLLGTWLVLYSVLRFVVELYRGDKIRGFLVEVTSERVSALLGVPSYEPILLTTSQAISAGLLLIGVVLLVWGRRRRVPD
jgi:phosphatidylglycerol:prolipoprotein diacylglycerol transferase